jgi:hypothetical protein
MGWIYLAEDGVRYQAVVSMGMNLRVLQKLESYLLIRTTASITRRTLIHGIDFIERAATDACQ